MADATLARPTDPGSGGANLDTDPGQAKLPRVLGPVTAFCVVVGSVIGSGIFIVPGDVAREVPAIGPIVLAWVVGGLFSAAGALTLAELGAMLPQAGGPYVYLREAYGRLPAFLFGWSELLINRTGSMATLAAAFARYFAQIVPAPVGTSTEVWQAVAAVSAIALVTLVNVLGTAMGGGLQVVGTAIKVGGVIVLIALPWLIGGGKLANLSPVWPAAFDQSLLSGAMVAMVGILWAYDGWMNLTPLAEEVRDPGRNIPRSLGIGMAVLIFLYVSMTLMYHYVLPLPDVQGAGGDASKAIAATYCKTLLGPRGVFAISLLVMCSTFISLNGNALTGPRAYFAMARDGLFFPGLCRVHPRFATPANAVITQGAWAIVLTVLGTVMILSPAPGPESALPGPLRAAWLKLNTTPLYKVLYTYVIFGANLFYMLAIASVFVLRKTRPDAPRPYRTWGYPFTPLLFVLAALFLLGDMLRQSPAESFAGIGIILTGLPVYLIFARRRAFGTGTSAPPS
jgi:APA family basic amino acid/polyamine antiporter